MTWVYDLFIPWYWSCLQCHEGTPSFGASVKPIQQNGWLYPLIVMTVLYQWEHLAWKTGVVAGRVQFWVRPMLSFLPQNPSWLLHHICNSSSPEAEAGRLL